MSECKHGKPEYSFCQECCRDMNAEIDMAKEKDKPAQEISHIDLVHRCKNYLYAVDQYNTNMNLTALQEANKAANKIKNLFNPYPEITKE